MRVCFVVSNAFALNAFLARPVEALAARGVEVTIAVNTQDGAIIAASVTGDATVVPIDIARPIAPLRDLRALWRLWRLFRRERFDIVHSITPKAGLLAMMAARAAGVPVRVHTFTGQVWATRSGFMRRLLRGMDSFLAWCATALLVDSHSQKDFLVTEGVVAGGRLNVLGQGSICGVDTRRFAPDATARAEVRQALGIPADAMVLLFVGRLHPEKGVGELLQAFALLAQGEEAPWLVLAGPDEGALAMRDRLPADVVARVRAPGHVTAPERYMAAADIFCLPSYREGFGLSLIEAAAAGLPSVATRIYGISDAVVDGETGLLVPVRDVNALAEAISALAGDESVRRRMADAARTRAISGFSQDTLLQAWLEFYEAQAQ